ncbi:MULTISPECIES: hypothetical protein [Streptomyces]|uniref:hypothetical protein n=1 Tax=Streptomyces TaxID=1883 RepID=UPI000B2EA19C|nr:MULTISPECIES: hypothetical protein [Streptomyces]MDP9954306.1 hypothetical protein [Streptomyces sp. DSM 41269]
MIRSFRGCGHAPGASPEDQDVITQPWTPGTGSARDVVVVLLNGAVADVRG